MTHTTLAENALVDDSNPGRRREVDVLALDLMLLDRAVLDDARRDAPVEDSAGGRQSGEPGGGHQNVTKDGP